MTELQNSLNANVSTPLKVIQGGTGLASTTANQLLYSSATSTIGGLATAANGILVTSAGSVPSISSTLPTAVQGNITEVGVVTTGTWEAIVTQYTETIFTHTVTTNYTINLANGNWQELTLSTNPTFSFSNVPATSGQGCSLTLTLIQDGTGTRTVTWPGSVDWGTAGAPVLTATAGGADEITMITANNGTRWRAFLAGKGFGG